MERRRVLTRGGGADDVAGGVPRVETEPRGGVGVRRVKVGERHVYGGKGGLPHRATAVEDYPNVEATVLRRHTSGK